MLSNNNTKFIKSLQLKKFRQKERLFIVEGEKNTVELLHSSYKIHSLIISTKFSEKYSGLLKQKSAPITISDEKTISKLGTYQTNEMALAVVEEPSPSEYNNSGFQLILDDIRDPGNLGTIIRIADWYGIKNIICSETTSEFYNPKVISASMGSVFRLNFFRYNLVEFLEKNKNIKVYGALMEGENVHKVKFDKNGFLIIGNESHGINDALLPFITEKVTIPRIGQAESLNAAMATAIICDNVFRDN
ncbi:RNA methyltransferase [Marivirga sp. S37H4]|uniref:RNA methyltransferase n=1 Tax=Marivirga aurantiaca TaxID=2802615 RepID=A0A935CAS9_9BACT|nr:RNA methyltransferase [Marivirga aurantiaca]MBK6266936.1 RNA methyltransferase [Marivirga aurantiaca]